MVLYIFFSNFMKTSLTIEFKEQTQFLYKITKGHNSAKEAGGVIVLVHCISVNDALHLYQVFSKYL